MRLSGVALLLPTFCVLVDAERAEGKVFKRRARTLHSQDTEGAEINIFNNTGQAKALQARVVQQAEVKFHTSNRKVSGKQVQATEVREGCDKVRELLTGSSSEEDIWDATRAANQDGGVVSQMNALIADNPGTDIAAHAELVKTDLEIFFGPVDGVDEFASSRRQQNYLAMFSKHLSYRCNALNLGCQDLLSANTPAKCWGALDEGRIYWGQPDVNPNFNGHNTQGAINALAPNNGLAGGSVWTVANRIKNNNGQKDILVVHVTRKDIQGGTEEWVALNNRGFTMHVLANVPPLRVFPRDPSTWSTDEANRVGFYETLDVVGVGHGQPNQNQLGQYSIGTNVQKVGNTNRFRVDLRPLDEKYLGGTHVW